MNNLEIIIPVTVIIISSIVGPMVVLWFKEYLYKRSTSDTDKVASAVATGDIIRLELMELYEELGCDRVWIAQFHNGGTFYPSGSSMMKFSVTYEICNPSVPPVQHMLQSVHITLFANLLNKLMKDSYVEVIRSQEMDPYSVRGLMTETNTQVSHMLGIRNRRDKLVGVIALSFTEDCNQGESLDWQLVNRKIGAIGLLLDDYH